MEALYTKRFVLKPLRPHHATLNYLSWLKDPVAKKHIAAARRTQNLQKLRAYILKFSRRKDCLFLRILEKRNGRHIGNLKYCPIDRVGGSAVMGILIGEPRWRGRRVAQEVIAASAACLRRQLGIRKIYLGVAEENFPAIRAYRKAGFRGIGRWPDGRKARAGQRIMLRSRA
jgi:RimJ/RimL family protein N-acetyltransferase